MPTDIHLICKHGDRFSKIGDATFETGNWYGITDATADEAIGGRIYLHERQRDPAWHGGTIRAWRPSEEPGRKVFTYVVDGPFRVRLKEGWGQEKAIIRRAAG
jgi:hypothetical protein